MSGHQERTIALPATKNVAVSVTEINQSSNVKGVDNMGKRKRANPRPESSGLAPSGGILGEAGRATGRDGSPSFYLPLTLERPMGNRSALEDILVAAGIRPDYAWEVARRLDQPWPCPHWSSEDVAGALLRWRHQSPAQAARAASLPETDPSTWAWPIDPYEAWFSSSGEA